MIGTGDRQKANGAGGGVCIVHRARGEAQDSVIGRGIGGDGAEVRFKDGPTIAEHLISAEQGLGELRNFSGAQGVVIMLYGGIHDEDYTMSIEIDETWRAIKSLIEARVREAVARERKDATAIAEAEEIIPSAIERVQKALERLDGQWA